MKEEQELSTGRATMAALGTAPGTSQYDVSDIESTDEDVPHSGRTRSLDDWLPITASRAAKKLYPMFHILTAVVGVGVLSLPSTMSHLGWGLGTGVVLVSWMITLCTVWMMVDMHEFVEGKRLNRYHELGQEAFGPRLGLWIVVPQQLVVEVGVSIVYMVTGGQSLRHFYRLLKCPSSPNSCGDIGLSAFIVIFASPQFLLAQRPNLNAISVTSMAAAVMSVTYSFLSVVLVGINSDGPSKVGPPSTKGNSASRAHRSPQKWL